MDMDVKPSEAASYLQGEAICAYAMIAAVVKILPDKAAFHREALAELERLRDLFLANSKAAPQLKAVEMTMLWLDDLVRTTATGPAQ